MNGWAGTSERRLFAALVAIVFGAVVAMLLLAPGDDLHAALLADGGPDQVPVPERAFDAVATVPAAAEDVAPLAAVPAIRREAAGQLPVLDDPRLPRLVAALRDDGVPGNALQALTTLSRWPAGRIVELDHALGSNDPQLRHFAAGVLRNRCRDGRDVPTPRLLRVSVDALRSDLGRVARDAWCTWVGPIVPRAARFLAEHARAAQAPLEQGLCGFDPQQRFLCAYLLAQAGLDERAGRIAYVLVEHLNDNRIPGDAAMATHGLYRLGEPALPVLAASRRYLDDQGQRLADLIREDLTQPPRSPRELRTRGSRVRVSPIYHDPAIEYDIRRSLVPQFSP